MPDAARLSDPTAHGGTVGPAVTGIAAKVVIGYLPAACMGDPQLCPASDGPKPHVGGVILKGSATVKIGNKAAARMGDPTECKGPPGTIAKGEPTVKIGDMGMGGAGGGGGGSEEGTDAGSVAGADANDVAAQIEALKNAAAAGMALCQQCTSQPAPPPPKPAKKSDDEAESKRKRGKRRRTGPGETGGGAGEGTEGTEGSEETPEGGATEFPPTATWIAVELVDADGNPIGNEPCDIMMPNGEVRKDKLNAEGKLRIDDIDPGTCQVVFPKLQERRRGRRPPR